MPTQNVKFEKFVTTILTASRLPKKQITDLKDEIIKYVQLLETSWSETVYDFRQMYEREKDSKRKIVNERASEVAQHNEFESLFVGCVEDVRKDIMKRRLKNEVYNKKKFH
jgi:hypothetical protein